MVRIKLIPLVGFLRSKYPDGLTMEVKTINEILSKLIEDYADLEYKYLSWFIDHTFLHIGKNVYTIKEAENIKLRDGDTIYLLTALDGG